LSTAGPEPNTRDEVGQDLQSTEALDMFVKLLAREGGLRTYAAILETDDEVTASVMDLARSEGLTGASFTGIGAFRSLVLQYFNWDARKYEDRPVEEQVEVASLIGDIGVDDEGEPAVHIHLVVGRRDSTALAGHLKEAYVRPTLELLVTETSADLRRVKDTRTGLNLIRL
jgi:predicted DNA-binding protein with PD1-like motif